MTTAQMNGLEYLTAIKMANYLVSDGTTHSHETQCSP